MSEGRRVSPIMPTRPVAMVVVARAAVDDERWRVFLLDTVLSQSPHDDRDSAFSMLLIHRQRIHTAESSHAAIWCDCVKELCCALGITYENSTMKYSIGCGALV